MRSKSTCLFFVTIFLASCAAPTPQATAAVIPTSTRTAAPIPTATQTLKPPSDSEPSWIQNGDELFIFDSASNEWIRTAQVSDIDPPVFEANGKSIIIVRDEWLAVTIKVEEDGQVTASTQDGQKWVWNGGEWEAIQVEQVASMEEFDYSLLWEKGAVIEVADYWGAGAATMTVEDTKGGTEALTYENMRVTPLSPVVSDGVRTDIVAFQFMNIEEMALVKVDLADNTRISDGYQLVMRLGTIDPNGDQISFTLVVDGNLFVESDLREEFAKMKRGDSVKISLMFYPDGVETLDENEEIMKGMGKEREEIAKRLFTSLGLGAQPMLLKDVRRVMKEGGVLDAGIFVSTFRLDNP